MNNPIVALVKGDSRTININHVLETIFANSSNVIRDPVILKPNLLSIRNNNASTNPDSISAVLSFLRKHYNGSIYIVEGSHVLPYAFQYYKLYDIAKEYRAKCLFIDTDEDEWIEIDMISLMGSHTKCRISKKVVNAGFRISITPPKTHANIGVSLTMKNMVGCIHKQDRKLVHGLAPDTPKEIKQMCRRRPWDQDTFTGMVLAQIVGKMRRIRSTIIHSDSKYDFIDHCAKIINQNIVALSKVAWPHLSIIDGFTGMEREGPWHGSQVTPKFALASFNYVAADIVGCRLMGFNERNIGYKLFLNEHAGGDIDFENIKIVGERFQNCYLRFKPHSVFINRL